MKYLKCSITTFAILISLSTIIVGQGIFGSIEGIVSDQTGAIIPGATAKVQSTGTTAVFDQTVTTNKKGYFTFPNVPPGNYKVSISSNGFDPYVRELSVVVDKATVARAFLTVLGSTNSTIVEMTQLDTTDSKIDTNITKEIVADVPKSTTFSSILKIAPNLRRERLAGGFQIDGGSGSDNTFFVDGQEVTNFLNGTLNANNDLPFELIQEVQVKSTGIDAEYSGSIGGVVNVVTAGGTDDWHGNFGLSIRPSQFESDPNPILTRFGSDAGEFEYFQPNKDKGTGYFPFASISGPILKDRVWGFFTYAPQMFRTTRTKDYFDTLNPNRSIITTETYKSNVRTEQAFGRIDAQPFSKLRVFGTYLWNPTIADGELPSTAISIGSPFVTVSEYANRGGRVNSNVLNGQATYNPFDWMFVNVRAGRGFLNEKIDSYGRNGGTRFAVSSSSPLDPCNPNDINIPGRTTECRGFNTGSNSINRLDSSTRTTFDADVGFVGINFFGRHNIKTGYQINDLHNDLNSGYVDTGYLLLYYGRPISAYVPIQPLPFCDFQNIPMGATNCTLGTARFVRIGEFGTADSETDAIYAQNSWQIKNRLTLNFGLRFENEKVPIFNNDQSTNPIEIDFGWGDKIAPRIGGAFDLFGDGNTRVFGSYGWFYDRVKHSLSRNSFSGSSIFLDAFAQITPARGLSPFDYTIEAMLGGRGIVRGGECPIQNQTGYIECELDRRIPTNQIPVPPPPAPIDPNIEPMSQSEYTFGVEHQIGTGFIVTGRYIHKQLDRIVEDMSVFNNLGSEFFFVGNPGRGLSCEISMAANLPCTKAERKYDAFELTVNKRAFKYFFNASYTYSRLFGNYSGLASSDEFGRTTPNANRFFDLPFQGYNADGVPDNGRLATDRPHVFKAYGGYSLNWDNGTNVTDFAAFTTIQSGTPLTTIYNLFNVNTTILFGRGDLGRTEMFTETDLAVSHKYKFGSDNKYELQPFLEIRNLFNENNEVGRDTSFGTNVLTAFDLESNGCVTCTDQFGVYQTILNGGGIQQFVLNFYNSVPPARNNTYNQTSVFQSGRDVRFGFRFKF